MPFPRKFAPQVQDSPKTPVDTIRSAGTKTNLAFISAIHKRVCSGLFKRRFSHARCLNLTIFIGIYEDACRVSGSFRHTNKIFRNSAIVRRKFTLLFLSKNIVTFSPFQFTLYLKAVILFVYLSPIF